MKATIKLPTGSIVKIDGTAEEVRALLDSYGGSSTPTKEPAVSGGTAAATSPKAPEDIITRIVNLVKTCGDAEKIEQTILNRTSQVDRVLLPLYVLHKEIGGKHWLTTGQIAEVTRGLGIPISPANASTTLSNVANKYVMTDGTSKRGKPTGYQINRRGIQYLAGVINGNSS